MNLGQGWKGYSGGLLTMAVGCGMLWWATQTQDPDVRALLLAQAGMAIPAGLALFGIRQAQAKAAEKVEVAKQETTQQIATVEKKVEAVQDATGAGGPRG